MTLALARRYRPKRFADLLVQDHVAAVLRGAIGKNRVGHGYLLTGPRGVGKTTAARILAMALNCERKAEVEPPGEPCGDCPSCLRIWNGSANLDVVEIDAASNRGVDDARELRERAMYAASQEGHHKVYIVDEAHMLTREAWNALLKILEEPPPGVVFVFATTEPQKIQQTAAPVMSRLQRFDFRRLGTATIRDRLRQVLAAEQIAADEDALTLIARQADGGMRDALSVLDQCLSFGEGSVTVQRVREILGLIDEELYGELLTAVVDRRPAGIFPLVDRLMDAGADLVEFIHGAGEALRALFMLQVGAEPEELTEGMRQTLQGFRGRIAPGDLLRMLKLIADTESSVRRGGNAKLVVETLLLRWAMMDRTVDLAEVLQSMAPAATGATGGSPGTERSPPHSAGGEPAPAAPPRPVSARSQAAAPAAPIGAPAPSPAPAQREPLAGIPFTIEALTARWPDLAAEARALSRFLGEAMAAARPSEVSPPALVLGLTEPNPMYSETLERHREALEGVLARAVGAPVRLAIAVPSPGRPRRISEAEIRADRLKALGAKDPTLEAAASELDLEVIE